VVVLAAILGAGLGSGSGAGAPATGAASIVPADALAYVNVSLDRGRPSVRRALAIAGRFGDFPLAAAGVLGRLSAILGGGRSVDLRRQIEPWARSRGRAGAAQHADLDRRLAARREHLGPGPGQDLHPL